MESNRATKSDKDFTNVSFARGYFINRETRKVKAKELESARNALMERLRKQYGDKFDELRSSNMGELWRSFVTTRADAEAMMEIMYPYLPKQVQQAYVHMFERAIRGEIQLDKQFIYTKEEEDARAKTMWDPIKDIEKERLEGLISLQEKRIRSLIEEEEEEEGHK